MTLSEGEGDRKKSLVHMGSETCHSGRKKKRRWENHQKRMVKITLPDRRHCRDALDETTSGKGVEL